MRFTPDELMLFAISVAGSLINVLLTPFRTVRNTLAQFISGVFIAFIFTNPIVHYFGIDPTYAGPVGGTLAMVGAGAARLVVEVSNEPQKAKGVISLVMDILSVIRGSGGRGKDDDDHRDPR